MKIVLNLLTVGAILALAAGSSLLAARGESLAALGTPFDGRCIPAPPQRGCRVGDPGAGCVAPRSNTPGIATPPRKPRAAGAPVSRSSRLAGGAGPPTRLPRWGPRGASPVSVRRQTFTTGCSGRLLAG